MATIISNCGKFRYRLEREIDDPVGELKVVFIGVNPSTADAVEDDTTIRKMRAFAHHWGCDRMMVGNICPWRATDVREIPDPDDIARELTINMEYLQGMIDAADIVCPCWGSRYKMKKVWHSHVDRVEHELYLEEKEVYIFGITKSGDPKHPLMQPYYEFERIAPCTED